MKFYKQERVSSFSTCETVRAPFHKENRYNQSTDRRYKYIMLYLNLESIREWAHGSRFPPMFSRNNKEPRVVKVKYEEAT